MCEIKVRRAQRVCAGGRGGRKFAKHGSDVAQWEWLSCGAAVAVAPVALLLIY